MLTNIRVISYDDVELHRESDISRKLRTITRHHVHHEEIFYSNEIMQLKKELLAISHELSRYVATLNQMNATTREFRSMRSIEHDKSMIRYTCDAFETTLQKMNEYYSKALVTYHICK